MTAEPDGARGEGAAGYAGEGRGRAETGDAAGSAGSAGFVDAGELGELEDFEARRARWASGWRRIVFPGVFLFYLGQTGHGIGVHSDGLAAVAGYVILAVFATCYVQALPAVVGGVHGRFWWWYGALIVLMVAELPFAHEDTFVMATFVVVLSLASLGRRAWPIVAALLALTLFLPPMIPSWDTGVDLDAAAGIVLVTLAMYGFFEVIRSNRALTAARAEVARLAAENERSRIARDLHDLLGHSLTTITVKAGLARRMTDVDPVRAGAEIAEVEELARRSLSEVRAAVAGYRDVTLTGELASGRELLRAAGIEADLPRSTEAVRPELHELFGWVVREGLTNVVRHARATRCTVTLTAGAVEIVDDGQAVDRPSPGPGARHEGSGLRGLRERLTAAGGTLTSGPASALGGWRLRAEVPLPDPPDQPPRPQPANRAEPVEPAVQADRVDRAEPAARAESVPDRVGPADRAGRVECAGRVERAEAAAVVEQDVPAERAEPPGAAGWRGRGGGVRQGTDG